MIVSEKARKNKLKWQISFTRRPQLDNEEEPIIEPTGHDNEFVDVDLGGGQQRSNNNARVVSTQPASSSQHAGGDQGAQPLANTNNSRSQGLCDRFSSTMAVKASLPEILFCHGGNSQRYGFV